MPEGPEIRRAADRIFKQVSKGPLSDVWFAFDTLKPHAETLIGRRVEAVDTGGKAMLIRFDDGRVLYSHNQLYGVWKCHRADTSPSTSRSLRVRLVAGGRAASLYSASDIEMWHSATLPEHPFLARLGPDLLSQSVTARQLVSRLTSRRFRGRSLAALLLDQSLVAGLGNYLRSEILFTVSRHPRDRPADLNDTQGMALAQAIIDVTWQAYRQAGVTNTPDAIEVAKAAGESRRHWRFAVFARDGRPCHRCGTSIERLTIGGRRLYLCPDCQLPLRKK